MESIFSVHLNRRFPLSMYFFELLEQLTSDIRDNADEENGDIVFTAAIDKALKGAGVCNNPKQDDIIYVVTRLDEIRVKAEKEAAGADANAIQKTGPKQFAEDAMKWISELTPDNMCLHIAGYNFDKGMELYCKVDREDVIHLGRQKVEQEWEMMRVKLEASLFGFGGGYGDGPNENETVIDLTDGNTAGLDQFFGKAH